MPRNFNSLKIKFLIILTWLVFNSGFAFAEKSIDKIVAIVNTDIVLQSELDQYVKRISAQLQSRHLKVPNRDILEKQALERLILRRIQLQLVKRSGIKVTDDAVNKYLTNLAKRQKMSLITFRSRLAKEGIDFDALRDQIREELALRILHRRRVQNRVVVSDEEVDRFLANQTQKIFRNNRFKIQQILISVPDGANATVIRARLAKAKRVLQKLKQGVKFSEAAVSWSDGQKALEGGVLGWFQTGQLPSIYVRQVVKMHVGDVSNIIRSPSGFHIVKLMDAKGGNTKRIVTKYRTRHILIRTNALISSEDAKSRLEKIRERIVNGEKFADLARANSDDTVSARKGGEIDWIGPGDTTPIYEAEVGKLKVGQVSQPFRTPYGWHIVQLMEKRKVDDTKNFRRNVAKQLIRSRKQRELIQNWLRRIRDESYVEYRNGKG